MKCSDLKPRCDRSKGVCRFVGVRIKCSVTFDKAQRRVIGQSEEIAVGLSLMGLEILKISPCFQMLGVVLREFL